MGELEQLPLERPQQSTEMNDQSIPAETGLMLAEQEQTLEASDIDALVHQAGELHGIHDVQLGLEGGIIGAGLQVMTDRYGADRLLDAFRAEGAMSFQGVVERLAPTKDEQEALYAAIKAEPMDALAARFDQTLGGVTDGNPQVTAMERFRRFEMFSVENARVMQDVDGNSVRRGRNTGGHTYSSGLLFTGDLDSLLDNNPDMVQHFRDTNDTLVLLKDITDIHAAKYEQFSAELAQAKAVVDKKVAEGEASLTEVQTLSEDIYGDETAKLQERLAGATSDAAREMIQGMLDKKTAEVAAAREDSRAKMEAIRSKVVADLSAERLYQLPVVAPIQPTPTYNDREEAAA